MNHEVLHRQFEVNYYRWVLREIKKEHQSNFNRLSIVNNRFIKQTLEAIKFFSYEEQFNIFTVLIKNYNKRILPIIGESITDEERVLLNRFELIRKNPDLKKKLDLEEKEFIKFKNITLRKIIKDVLHMKLKPKFYSVSWFDTFYHKNWVIKTYITIEPYYYEYNHIICYLDKDRNIEVRLGQPVINLSTWFGVYPTGWVFRNKEDVERTANLIAELCEYFLLEASKEILDGLEDIPS